QFGMLPAFASEIAFRNGAFASGSPPPVRAATVSSLMNFVKSLPRLASSAPFLCLMECHFECPDIKCSSLNYWFEFDRRLYHKARGGRRHGNRYFNFSYSARAATNAGSEASASFHTARKSW